MALSGFLTGVSPFDPWTLAAVVVVVVTAAFLAGLGPAWRATRVLPLVALRDQ